LSLNTSILYTEKADHESMSEKKTTAAQNILLTEMQKMVFLARGKYVDKSRIMVVAS